MRFAYKDVPNAKGLNDWIAVVPVQISDPARHSPPCRRFEAVIDSGATICLFHASVGESIGLKIDKGEPDEMMGINGVPTAIFTHTISLHVLGSMFKIKAGFTSGLPLAGLLGRIGFFEHFKITFDHSSKPPGFELERIYRA